MSSTKSISKTRLERYFPWLLVVGGLVGLGAAFALMMDKLALLENPDRVLSCDLNPIVACSSVINTAQASAFGFPNPILGLISFTVIIVTGINLLAGGQLNKAWYWRVLWLGMLFGVVFVHWLFFQSVYRINALCPYCMAVWTAMIAIFWYTTIWNLRRGFLALPEKWSQLQGFIQRNHLGILIIWYLIIAFFIINKFWY